MGSFNDCLICNEGAKLIAVILKVNISSPPYKNAANIPVTKLTPTVGDHQCGVCCSGRTADQIFRIKELLG
jgi:hypothetical protein